MGHRTLKRAEDIRRGDAIVFLSRAHTIDRIDPYTGPFDAVGVARSGEWGITLFPGQMLEVLDCGDPGHDFTDHLVEVTP